MSLETSEILTGIDLQDRQNTSFLADSYPEPQALDEIAPETFHAGMKKGLEQAVNDQARSAEEVFSSISVVFGF